MADLELKRVEYRVKPVTRYIVTRYHEGTDLAGVEQKGEYESADMAYEVGYALAKQEHGYLGWPIADDRIQYPRHPKEEGAIPISG